MYCTTRQVYVCNIHLTTKFINSSPVLGEVYLSVDDRIGVHSSPNRRVTDACFDDGREQDLIDRLLAKKKNKNAADYRDIRERKWKSASFP